MLYPTLPITAKAFNLASKGAYSPYYDIVWSFDYAISGNSNTEGGFTVFIMDNMPLSGGNSGIDLGYSGLSSQDVVGGTIKPGISGAKLACGFDTTGSFGLSAELTGSNFIRDGVNDNSRLLNSVALRSGWPTYSFNTYTYYKPISSLTSNTFNIVENGIVYKTIRARLGNIGRTLYIDYRDSVNDDYINLVTQNVSLNSPISALYKVGVSFATPITGGSSGIIYLKNFHTEGSDVVPLSSLCINCDQPAITGISLDTTCLHPSCIDPNPECDINCNEGGPTITTFDVAKLSGANTSFVYNYISEGRISGLDKCNINPCENIATGYDLFNFGYKLSAIEVNKVLERISAFEFRDSTNTYQLKLTAFNEPWRFIDNSLNTLVGSPQEPVGQYTGAYSLSVIYVQ